MRLLHIWTWPDYCNYIQLHKSVVSTMESIVKAASRDYRQAERILSTRYKLTNYKCYEPAVELFDERCFDISQVCTHWPSFTGVGHEAVSWFCPLGSICLIIRRCNSLHCRMTMLWGICTSWSTFVKSKFVWKLSLKLLPKHVISTKAPFCQQDGIKFVPSFSSFIVFVLVSSLEMIH